MTYDYKYTPAALSNTPKPNTNPKNQYIGLAQETLNQQFYNSSNWWSIQEEVVFGKHEYQCVDVRIAHVINAETGLKLGDDWKSLLFKDINHLTELGREYVFDNNTWLTVNIETIKNVFGTCTVRRCNNTLRWIDEKTGAYYIEPCIIEYEVKEPRDYATQGSPFMTPGGFLKIHTQFNDRTNKINENQRFLFGNVQHWTCYKVTGTGIADFQNRETYNNDTPRILTLNLTANFINNELDDVINGIADAKTNVYTLTLNRNSAEGAPTNTIQLDANVTYNGNSVTRPLTWASSNTSVATVSGSGLATLLTAGSCIITASITGNVISGSCLITVSASPAMNTDVIITPEANYILEGSQEAYSVYLYKNGIQQADTFSFVCNANSVPSTSYIFTTVDGNHFTINNILRNITSNLSIECTSGSTIKTFDIYLRGAWLYDNA